ncbi:hypothetical protein Dsin_012761 [Dipteronia sinensis]|uniref:Uncharacterized protein n=1 Tax=Dipteronia sinensis TaxID=43782 RepID=A0AAE0AIV9_9ROSI|nr:hypothetical protein Dsin_012761 [Dipteronia sinensis]
MPADPPKKPPQIIKKNCRFFRRPNREVSMSNMDDHNNNNSNNNYDIDGGISSVSVPFRWESEPGTPKVRSRDNPLPPLTPPPSYFYSPKTPTTSSKSHFLDTIFPRRATNKKTTSSKSSQHLPSSPVFSSSSSSGSSSGSSWPWPVSSSSYSVPSSPARRSNFRRRCRNVSSPRPSFDSRAAVETNDDFSSLCFGQGGTNARFRGCYASMIKVLLN